MKKEDFKYIIFLNKRLTSFIEKEANKNLTTFNDMLIQILTKYMKNTK